MKICIGSDNLCKSQGSNDFASLFHKSVNGTFAVLLQNHNYTIIFEHYCVEFYVTTILSFTAQSNLRQSFSETPQNTRV